MIQAKADPGREQLKDGGGHCRPHLLTSPGFGPLVLLGSSLFFQDLCSGAIQLPPETTISLLIGGKLVANCQEIADFPSITGGDRPVKLWGPLGGKQMLIRPCS